jgi:hypothetical protein
MSIARPGDEARDSASIPPIPGEPERPPVQAWQLIDKGRYMPRRIRGSFPGRELG